MSRVVRLMLVAVSAGWALGAELLYRTLHDNQLAHHTVDAVGGWLAVAVAGAVLLVLITWRPEDPRARHMLQTLTSALESIDLVTEPSPDRQSLDDALEVMLERVSRALAADAGVIYVLSDDEKVLTMQAASGLAGISDSVLDVPVGQGIVGRVAASGQPMVVNDLRASDVYSPFLRERLTSLVATPLTVDGRLAGVLAVGTATRRQFRDTDLRLLRLASERMAVGMERARLYESQRRARLSAEGAQNQMTVLARAGEVLAGALDDYNPSIQALGRALVPGYADWFAVRLAEADRSLGAVDRAWGGRPLENRRAGSPRLVAGWEELADRVVAERHAVLLHGGAPDTTDTDQKLLEDNGLQSVMAVPIRVRGLSFGAIGFATYPERRGFRPSDLRTAEGVAQRVAAAIERVLLYREAREAERAALANASQLRRLMAAALTVNRPLSEMQILDVVAEQARRVMQSDQAVVSVGTPPGEPVRAFSPADPGAMTVEALEQLVTRSGRSARGGPGDASDVGSPSGNGARPGLPERPWLAAPLTDAAGNPIGSIVLIGAERGAFSPEDEAILVSIAQMASVALGNARLYEEVQANGQRLETLMESSPLAIVELDLEAGARWWNPAACSLFGWDGPGDLAPGAARPDLTSVLSPELSSELSRLWYRAVRGQATVGVEFSLQREGATRHLSVSTAPMRSDEGTVTGFMALVEDITERRRLEDQFHQAERLEAMGRLAGGVAHDFNNLVSVILGYSEMLLRREQEGTVREGLEAIARAGRRAAALTGQLLAVGRREVGHPSVVDPAAAVQEMEQMILSLLGADISARFRFNSDRARVLIDRSQLERAVLNLVINARDAMPSGGRLSVRVGTVELDLDSVPASTKPGPYVELEVSDTGQGMDADTLEHCFEPFFTTKDRTKGTGLGLAAVHGVVTGAGGAVNVRSRPGRGTSFTLLLPSVAADLEVADELGGRPAREGSATILLVEDEDELRNLAGRGLESHGYRIVPAADAQEAIRLADQLDGSIDLLLTDVIMPGMSGPELARHLLGTRPDLPVLFISGYTGDDKLAAGRLPPDADLLPKPFGPEELRLRVEDALDRAEIQRSAREPQPSA